MSASTISIHDILDKDDWYYDELKLFLEKDASSINQLNRGQFAPPLHRVLLNTKKRSPDLVRLLLHHGADVHLEFSDGKSLLQKLLLNEYLRQYDDKIGQIIKVLLERGADMKKLTRHGQSLLCLAFSYSNINISGMLIEAGCPMDSCLIHESIIQCLMASLKTEYLNKDLLKLMIQKCKGRDLNILDNEGRSLLCYALTQFPGSDIFNFMLESGCSWNACKYHISPWLCATNGSHGRVPHLTKNFVQMLIDVDAEPNVDDEINEPLLHCALKYCTYDISAIQLMIDTGVVQMGRKSHSEDESDLHAAVSNIFGGFNPEIVKFLVDRGADINAKEVNLNTPLHLAIMSNFASCNGSKIETLLKNGASVDEMCGEGIPLLWLWAERGQDLVVLSLLLNAGAKINFGKQTFEVLINAMGGYTRHPYEFHIPCTKLLIRYSLLEDPSIDMDALVPKYYGDFANFVKECRDELKCMKSININQKCTLHQLISRSSQKEIEAEDYEPVNVDRLINALVYNKFHAYFDVICTMLDRKDIEPKLQGIIWCAVKSDPETFANTNVFLNSHTIFEIASNLSNEELLKLIISSHILEK